MASSFISFPQFLRLGEQHVRVVLAAFAVFTFVGIVFFYFYSRPKSLPPALEKVFSYLKFFYVSFLKPHTGDGGGGQQDALESFYRVQVCYTYLIYGRG